MSVVVGSTNLLVVVDAAGLPEGKEKESQNVVKDPRAPEVEPQYWQEVVRILRSIVLFIFKRGNYY